MQPQGELMQEPLEAPKEQQAGEEHKRLTLHLNPIDLDPNVTAPPKSSPLLEVPSLDPNPVYILPTTQQPPETPPTKVILFTLPALQNLRKLVATVQTFATTS